jgi:hypothetical protein
MKTENEVLAEINKNDIGSIEQNEFFKGWVKALKWVLQ